MRGPGDGGWKALQFDGTHVHISEDLNGMSNIPREVSVSKYSADSNAAQEMPSGQQTVSVDLIKSLVYGSGKGVYA
ncbi:MAG: hypothetical protein DHS20C01_16560 [marine bacterium B5-7]|nr:MAG: hypothetical protein DHS20C01_16560 [marine bacterium B5-7]